MTTTNSLVVAGNPTGAGGAFGSTVFFNLAGQMSTNVTATEAAIAETNQTALTLANFGALIITGNASTQTLRSRIATANGNQVLSITGSGTGWFTDSTHSDSVTAGQAYDSSWQTGGGGSTGALLQFAAQKTGPVVVWGGTGNGNLGFATSTNYSYPFGSADSLATESIMQAKTRAAGTWASLQIGIAGAVTGTITIKSRKNTADGNQVLSAVNPGANTTVQDTTHSDSVASGDLLAISAVCLAASGSWRWHYSEFAGTISAHDLGTFASGTSGQGTNFSASTSYFWPLSGPLTANTTESKVQATLPYALTASKLRSLVHTNSAATITIKSRKGGADGNQTISVSSGSTGEVEDTTHSDSYVSTNTINITGVTGTLTTLKLDNVRMLVDDGSVAAFNTETGTATMALSGVSFTASGTDRHTGTGTMALSGVSYAAAGTRKETSTGALALSGVSFSGVGSVRHTGTGAMALSGISFAASGSRVESGSASLALSGISFVAAGARMESGIGRMALSGISYVAAGVRTETGTGRLALSGVSYVALGKRGPAGHATMALSGVSIVALGFDLGHAGDGVRQFWTF